MSTMALTHISRYPRARSSTIAHLIQRDRVNEQLRNEVRYRRAAQLALIISIMVYDLEDALMDGLAADPEYRAVLA